MIAAEALALIAAAAALLCVLALTADASRPVIGRSMRAGLPWRLQL
jgi:hypothetical protein